MADIYEQWMEKAEGRKAFFYTDEEGRVRFAGGPGGGAGGSAGGGAAGGTSSIVATSSGSVSPEIVKNLQPVSAGDLSPGQRIVDDTRYIATVIGRDKIDPTKLSESGYTEQDYAKYLQRVNIQRQDGSVHSVYPRVVVRNLPPQIKIEYSD
jgi:hypothetical protein